MRFNTLLLFVTFWVVITTIHASAFEFEDNFNDCDVSDWELSAGSSWSAVSTEPSYDSTCYMNSSRTSGGTTYYDYANKSLGISNPVYWSWNQNRNGTSSSGNTLSILIFDGSKGVITNIGATLATVDDVGLTGYTSWTYPKADWVTITVYENGANLVITGYAQNGTVLNTQTIVAPSYTYKNIIYIKKITQGSVTSTVRLDNLVADTINPGFGIVTAPSTVNLNTNATISYSYGSQDTTTFDYMVDVYDATATLTSLSTGTSSSGNVTYNTVGGTEGTYLVYLVAEHKSTNVKYYLAYDTMFVDSNVAIYGYTRNAITGAVVGSANVNFSQLGTWYNTTSDANGFYTLSGMVSGYSVAINASKSGYVHFDYTYTPSYDYNYSVDLFLWDTSAHGGDTGVEGLTVSPPFRTAVGSATVNLWNSTTNWTETSGSSGYWSHTLSDMSDTINGNASKSGYATTDDQSTPITSTQWSQMIFTLTPEYHVTIRAKDSVTDGYLSTFTVTADSGSNSITQTVTNGTVSFTTSEGLYYITASASGYYGAAGYYLITADRNIEFSLTPYTNTNGSLVNIPGFGSQRYLHYVQFIPQRINGTRYAGILANYTATDSNGSTLTGSGTTGSDGIVGFEMTQNLSYTITFTNASLGIDKTITVYPISDVYTVCIDTNCTNTFVTGSITNATLTNYTTNYTSKPWSVQNLTNTTLTSDIGLGPTGQGILAGITMWFVVGAGGPVTAIVSMAILAWLGIVTWVMLLFVTMTAISVYVLRGWLG